MAAVELPYTVTDIRHERAYQPGGTMAGMYHVKIKHKSGLESSFVVPEGANAARDAHTMAMRHVEQANAIKALPDGFGRM